MKQGTQLLAASLLLACICSHPAAAGPARGLMQTGDSSSPMVGADSGNPTVGDGTPPVVTGPSSPKPKLRKQRNTVYLPSSSTSATMTINAVYDAVSKSVSMVKAAGEFEYCAADLGTAACSDGTGMCTGAFTTLDACTALPQLKYPPCGVFLKVPKRQVVSAAGGFDIGLDMVTKGRLSCVLPKRRRSSRRRRLLLDLINVTAFNPSGTYVGTPDLGDGYNPTFVYTGFPTIVYDPNGLPLLHFPPTSTDTPFVFNPTTPDLGGENPNPDVPPFVVSQPPDTPIVVTPPPDVTEPPTIDTPNDPADPPRPPIVYTGGPCIVNLKNVPGAGPCTCYKGQISTKISNKAMKAVHTGVGAAISRWRCKGLLPEPCGPNACA